jgi:DNA-binding transcriptional MerR regulator
MMHPPRADGLLTTPEAARLVGVQPVTIRQWRNRGHLVAQGLDERGRPLHTREAVRAAEQRVRQNGLAASGIDPRQLRRPAPLPLAA